MRLTLRSSAAAVFIGGCAAAGLAVASASTPAQHDSSASSQLTRIDPGTSTNAEFHLLHALTRVNAHSHAAHLAAPRANGTDETLPPSTVPSQDASETESPDPVETESSQPVEDNQGDDNDQGDENSPSASPTDDNQGEDQSGDDNGGSDNNPSAVPSSSSSDGSGGGDGGGSDG